MSLIPTRLLMLSAVLCLTGCRSVEREGDGDSARFSMGNSFYSSEYIMKKSRLSHFTIGYNGADRKRTSTKKLTPEELAAFWKALEETGVYRWRTHYKPSRNSICDANSWDITIYKEGRKVFQSAGYEAFPSDEDPQKTTSFEETDRYLRVINLFETDPRHQARVAPLKKEHD
ncbi:MAG: hypothetical protein NTY98_04565 [Verrucomicrobia bacterium]|nr:hypothetical protein [Verrucomicrobiota bacterium]